MRLFIFYFMFFILALPSAMPKLNQLTNSDFCFSFSIIPFASFSPSNELEGQIKTLLYNKLLCKSSKTTPTYFDFILRAEEIESPFSSINFL